MGWPGVVRGEGKTDAKDAALVADVARMRRDLTTITRSDELVVELTRLTAHRADLMADWVRGINRLRELLCSIFPGLEAAFDYSTRSALVLVTGFCTPIEVRHAGRDVLTEYLAENGAWRKGIQAMATTAVQTAEEQTVALPGEATTAVLIKRLARKLLDLNREIKDTDKLITSRFREHPQAHIIERLPSMGPILGAEFLVGVAGDVQSAFGNPGQLAAYAGLDTCPKGLRSRHRKLATTETLQPLPAPGVLHGRIIQPPDQRPFPHLLPAQTRGNRIHTQALLALARRLVDVLWALLRDNRRFTPAAPIPAATA
jgi:transposase